MGSCQVKQRCLRSFMLTQKITVGLLEAFTQTDNTFFFIPLKTDFQNLNFKKFFESCCEATYGSVTMAFQGSTFKAMDNGQPWSITF